MAKKTEKSSSEVFHPSQKVVESAHIKEYDSLCKRAIEDREGFWAQQAGVDPGGRAGRFTHFFLPCTEPRSVQVCQYSGKHGRAEGAPNHPYPNRWWQMIEKYGITILYTSPTAIRGLMRFGEAWPNRHDLSSLRLLGSVGGPINPEAWRWYYRVIGREKCPVMDTWWQTETGGFMITPLPITPLKPGSATKSFFGNEVAVADDDGEEVQPGEDGKLVIKNPWPGMARTIFGDPDRYREVYWKEFEKQGWYKAGDSARVDQDGYIWIIGRIDDAIKVSGYRLGTAEIESALVSHPSVAEAAAIALPRELKGHAIHAFVILKAGKTGDKGLAEELKDHVSHEMGPIARPEEILFTDSLPKTRSGKIMRRVPKARVLGQDEGDLTTLEK